MSFAPPAGAVAPLVLETFFVGTTRARGIFVDRRGRVRNRFEALIHGHCAGATLTLDKQLAFADGTIQHHRWQIRRRGTQGYVARGTDLVGEAEGSCEATALRWRYRAVVPMGGTGRVLRFDDWMFLQPGGRLVHRARLSKFGLLIGEVSLFYDRERTAADLPASQIA